MTPYKYDVIDGLTCFRYKYSKLKEFIKRGREFGDSGWILISRKDKHFTYICFGTIENPSKEVRYITVVNNELFDGVIKSDDDLCKEKPSMFDNTESYKMYFIDLSK